MPEIVFLDESTLGGVDNLELIRTFGTYRSYPFTGHSERIPRIGEAQIVLTNKVVIDQEVMDRCPNLKLICITATGMNNVDLEYAAKKGISVKNVAGYSTESVAQSTFSMLLYLLHQNSYYDRYVKSGEYQKSRIFTHYGPEFTELAGKQYGIIGLGTIGKRVAELAEAFGMKVVFYSTSGRNQHDRYPSLSLDELLATSDVISIHCPLNEKTNNLLGEEELKKMKGTAILLNMGRGGIVNEQALAEAIDNGTIAAAGIDVLTTEPIRDNNPLLGVKHGHKLFITPHIAWASLEARRLLVEKIAVNIRQFQESSGN